MQIANPMYDVVFKYLLDDNKIAKKLISLIIAQEIETLDLKPTEIRNDISQRPITVLHIDFCATIKLKNGEYKKIIIELQKAKFYTDIQRFRRYLATQYSDPSNSFEKNGRQIPMPIFSIYFLGHYLDNIKAPVISVNRNYIDVATKKVITQKNDFIEALTHDSIIIQIDALKKHRRNKLEKVLSVFETGQNHFIDIQESDYPKEYSEIIRRLLKAAAQPKLRESMTIEDEYVKELESLERDIEKQVLALIEKDQTIIEKNQTIIEKDQTIIEKEELIQQQNHNLDLAIQSLADSLNISHEKAKELIFKNK
ncbi:MAG: hypothetical protein COB02_17360 [Candidatus Cloacimonadota bacterium]|nr:MAG: hypothetical protein COB02_17360 [Candidatus Cloacimonadota bacterium]